MELRYFRDDQALVPEQHVGPRSLAGVSFGWPAAPELGCEERMFRITWPAAEGGLVWTFAQMYPGLDSMGELPALQDALTRLPRRATLSEVVTVLESVGFTNGRLAYLAGPG